MNNHSLMCNRCFEYIQIEDNNNFTNICQLCIEDLSRDWTPSEDIIREYIND